MANFDNSLNYKVSRINLDSIITDNIHSYKDEEIEELAYSIVENGMIQYIIVLDNNDGTYTLLSGHKRLLAYYKLLAMDKDSYSSIPAFILNDESFNINLPISEESKKLYTITMINLMQKNKETRTTYKEFLALQSIFLEAKNNGHKFGERLRRLLAYLMKLSPTTIGRMEFVQKHACEATINALTSNKISINQAETIASKPKEEQEKIICDFLISLENTSTSTNGRYGVTGSDYSTIYTKCNGIKKTCDSISTLLSAEGSIELTKDDYTKFQNIKEDIEKVANRMESYYAKMQKLFEASQEDVLYPRMLVRKARLELLKTNSTTVICPKCNQSPVIKYTPNHERTLITCPCGYVHEIEINF